MIWFKLSLEEKTLDDSEELTQKVRELLDVDDMYGEVLYTGSHEINEEWEFDLLAEGQEEEPIALASHELIVITSIEDKKYIQITCGDLPAMYVTAP
tara:strand:- start:290 stop:580 length:291 start_codon:yes stop_codon:yes gene_type:complete